MRDRAVAPYGDALETFLPAHMRQVDLRQRIVRDDFNLNAPRRA
jgi:hypothetical protein